MPVSQTICKFMQVFTKHSNSPSSKEISKEGKILSVVIILRTHFTFNSVKLAVYCATAKQKVTRLIGYP